MQVDIIKTYAEFEKLKSNWNEIYLLDPEAQYFLSWDWLSQVFAEHPTGWFILAVKHDQVKNKYVAFFPLRMKLKMSKTLQEMYNEISVAGRFFRTDYAGFVCDPAFDNVAIPLLALQIQNMSWRECHLKNLYISDQRLSLFLTLFSNDKFSGSFLERIGKDDNINRLICPYVELPKSFESYLNENLPNNTRQKVRRHLRKVDNSETFKIIQSTPSTYQRDLDILVHFLRNKWAQNKGKKVDRLADKYRAILQQGLKNNSVFLPVLWQGDKPIAALGSFIDRQKQAMLYLVAGRDESCSSPPPELVLHAHSIRWAISNGLKSYDFSGGNEPFKYSWGATDRRLRYLFIETKSSANLNLTLDLGFLDQVLGQTKAYQESGRLIDAEIGYRQLLEICPQHLSTIGDYARLLYNRKKYAKARRAYLKLLQGDPKNITGWLGLGKSLLALKKYRYAERAIRKAIHLSGAETIENRYYLGLALLGQNQESATTEFTMALNIKATDERGVRKQKYARGFIEQFAVT